MGLEDRIPLPHKAFRSRTTAPRGVVVTRVPHLPEPGSPARRGSPAPRTTRRVFRHTRPRPARRRAGGPPSGAPAPACGYPGSPAHATAEVGAGVGAHTPGRGGGVRARRAATAAARMVSPAAWSEGAGPFEREQPVEWGVAPVTPGSNEVAPRRWTGRAAGGPGAVRRRRPPRGPEPSASPRRGPGPSAPSAHAGPGRGSSGRRAAGACPLTCAAVLPGRAAPAPGGTGGPHRPRAAREGGRRGPRGAATAGWRPGRGRRAAPSG